jgi:hypothetical protein
VAHQVPVTVRATVLDGQVPAVRKLLSELRRHGPTDDRMPFAALKDVHFARLFLLEETTDLAGEVIPASLVYMADVDGSVHSHLRGLVSRAGAGLDDLFGLCTGYPPDATDRDRLGWLKEHCLRRPAAYYVHNVGRTVRRVQDEARLHAEVEDLLDRPEVAGEASPAAVRSRVRQAVLARPDLAWATRPAAGPGLVHRAREAVHLVAVPAAVLLTLPVLLPVAVAGLVAIRLRERRDRPETGPPDAEHVHEVERYEDFAAQNPFTAVGFLKPGLLRQVTMRVALGGLDWTCRHLFTRDNLAGVRTIHFARWLPLDDGRRVVFASSYDGSQESYMDDFIDRLHWGINLVFSNGLGFPRTRWLVNGGARDETSYKRYLRRHQVPTVVFYSAYDRLSARNVDDNSLIRAGLRGGDADAARWLELL